MATIPTPELAECTCRVAAQHRILDRACPRHGTAADAARQHRSWCDPDECYTRQDDRIVHRSAGEVFELNTNQVLTSSMLTVQLVDTSEDIEVGLTVEGAAARSSATVLPETAVELAKSLLEHAELAGEPSMAMTADLAVLLEALDDVSISDDERHSLRWLCAYGAHTVEHLAALITRARRNSTADR